MNDNAKNLVIVELLINQQMNDHDSLYFLIQTLTTQKMDAFEMINSFYDEISKFHRY